MGKRVRSLSIQFGDHDIHLTTHAAWRFRNRVQRMLTRLCDMTPHMIDQAATMIRPMIGECESVVRRTKHDSRIYLSHPQCVFVLTTHGTIVTVLRRSDGDRQFADSIKEVRRDKRTAFMRDNRHSRWRRIANERHQRKNHLTDRDHLTDHDHDHDHEHDED